MAQQTAVKFYHSKIKSIMGNWTPMLIEIFEETFEQAKAMEKQQIIKSRENGISEGYRRTNNFYYDKMIDSEEYYNKTFKLEVK